MSLVRVFLRPQEKVDAASKESHVRTVDCIAVSATEGFFVSDTRNTRMSSVDCIAVSATEGFFVSDTRNSRMSSVDCLLMFSYSVFLCRTQLKPPPSPLAVQI